MSIPTKEGWKVVSNERLHELADRAEKCIDIMGDVTVAEAILVLGMISYVGCDGKKKRYMTIQEDLHKLYPILRQIMEAEE